MIKQPKQLSVADYLAKIDDPLRRADCETMLKLMRRVTRQEPVLWGRNVVGFGRYKYKYESGHSGEFCITGFSTRKGDISVYLVAASPVQPELLVRLGKHKMGKACLYIKRLADVDLKILEQLVMASVAEVKRRYP